MSQSRIAILAALNIADEFHQEKEAKEKVQLELQSQATKLGELLDDKIGVEG